MRCFLNFPTSFWLQIFTVKHSSYLCIRGAGITHHLMFASLKNAHRYSGKARPPPQRQLRERRLGESLCLIAKLSVNKISDLPSGLRIRIHFIRIRIQHFRLNTDPDLDPIWIRTRIRIQSGYRALMTKNCKKKIQLKKKINPAYHDYR
jgi:hypothetical protein